VSGLCPSIVVPGDEERGGLEGIVGGESRVTWGGAAPKGTQDSVDRLLRAQPLRIARGVSRRAGSRRAVSARRLRRLRSTTPAALSPRVPRAPPPRPPRGAPPPPSGSGAPLPCSDLLSRGLTTTDDIIIVTWLDEFLH